jgi:hypothetical protein
MQRIRDLVVQPANPRSLSARARARRWRELLDRFPDLASMRVLDLGGTPRYWRAAPAHPAHLTIVNINAALRAEEPWIDLIAEDACAPTLPIGRFDLVVSNSLLEHLGDAARRRQFAEVVRGAADQYWVQTPNRYFPIEPHWLFPGFQFLPFGARVLVTRVWPLGHRRSRDPNRATGLVSEVELVGPSDMRRYFPDAEIWIERFAGLPKSIVAIRSRGGGGLSAGGHQGTVPA